jgi:hypothetical protein
MARKKFNEEEMNHLRSSPYVLDVSASIVHFSAEFKKLFWEAILSGKKPCDIVMELGIDPDILGDTRVAGLKGMIRNEVKSGKGFRDIDTYNNYLDGYITPEAKIKYLQQQIAYKDQEIDFLKKIVFLSKEGSE